MIFDTQDLKIRCIYKSDELDRFKTELYSSEKANKIFTYPVKISDIPADKPYLYASYVESLDGKLSYPSDPDAFYVAQKNHLSIHGKTVDYWILNYLRASCDAALIGGNTLHIDPNYLMVTEDADLQCDRRKNNLSEYPIQIITSLDATDVPMTHSLLTQNKFPRLLSTSPAGWKYLSDHYSGELFRIENTMKDVDTILRSKALPVLVTGKDARPDTKSVMKLLRQSGIEKLLIESPGYGHHLIQEKLLDEIFFNFSCVYIGGDGMTLGKNSKGFTPENHPYGRVLSVHNYNDFYFYFRYQMIYEEMD